MSEIEYPSYKLKVADTLFGPALHFLNENGITGFLLPFFTLMIIAYFFFRNRPKKSKLKVEEILLVIGIMLCLIMGIIDQYLKLMKLFHR